LEALVLSLRDEQKLGERLDSDILGFFERQSLTLLQALVDLERGDRLWACVKLYYSIFYALRVELNLEGIAAIRGRKFYSCRCIQGNKVQQYNGKQTGDHGVAIALASKHLSGQDILQSAKISDQLPYMWMKGLRETVQYKLRRPPEVDGFDPFFPSDQISIHDQVGIFLADSDPYYPFDPDFAALAIAVKRFQLTAQRVRNSGLMLNVDFNALVAGRMSAGGATTLLRPYFW
jgi:hypothetical protein